MGIENIVTVTVSRVSSQITRQGFGTLLIVGAIHTHFAERLRYYTSAADMLTDGFLAADAAYKAAVQAFSQEYKPTRIAVGRIEAAETPDVYLPAIAAEQPDFYGVCITDRTQANVELMAAWVEANSRVALTASDDTDILDSGVATDVATVLNGLNYDRTGVIYSADAANSYPDAGALAYFLATTPGSATLKFKTVVGTPTDLLTETQRTNALAVSANVYESIAGHDMLSEGTMASGEFLDVMRDLDWHTAQIRENVFALLISQDKTPITDAGIGAIEAVIKQQQAAAVEAGVLAADPAPTVTVPKASDIPAADRSARKISAGLIKFGGQLAGSIHNLSIDGTIVA